MTTISESPHPQKPNVPPLLRESFNRLPHPLLHLPDFARSSPFQASKLPQLPPIYDARLAAVITNESESEDVFGVDRQVWDEEKHTLISLALRGKMYLRSKVMEKVQDLAPGPFKDVRSIQNLTIMMGSTETYALLAMNYNFPCPTLEPLPADRSHSSTSRVQHAANMYLAYIGALRIPYKRNEQLGYDILTRLDKYIDDLISPNVWIKLDDLVKQRSRGEKFGEQQLLNPAKRTLAERMWSNKPAAPRSISQGGVRAQVPSFELNGPSLLHSPSVRSTPLRSVSAPNRQPERLPARPSSPSWDGYDDSDDFFRDGAGPMRTDRRARGRGPPSHAPSGPRGGQARRLSVR